MKQVWYLAHPVSGTPEELEANLANAVTWIKWLTLNVPERVYIAPWIAEVTAFQGAGEEIDAAFYDRVLEDDCDVVRHTDGILLVGGRISRGMQIERNAAWDHDLPVADYSGVRSPPPSGEPSRALRELLLSDWRDDIGP
jgi:hypothetical protein